MCTCSDMKNAVIGNNKQKANLIVLGAVPRSVSSVCSQSHCLCSSFKMICEELYLYSSSQVALPIAAELIQRGTAD